MKALVNPRADSAQQKNVVAFKLDDAAFAALTRLAAAHDKSPGLFVKDLALRALDVGAQTAMAELAHELRQLYRSLAESVLVLLVKAGGVEPSEARAWARETWPERPDR